MFDSFDIILQIYEKSGLDVFFDSPIMLDNPENFYKFVYN
jgi:hypothetical protein